MSISALTVEATLADTGARNVYNIAVVGGTNGSSSSTWTPPGDALLLVGVNRSRLTPGNTPTLSDSASQVSWSAAQNAEAFDNTATPTHHLMWFWGVTGASPSATRLVLDFAGDVQTGCAVLCVSMTVTHLTTPIAQSKSRQLNAQSSIDVTLDASVTAGNATVAFCAANVTSNITPRTNWTEPANGEVSYATPLTVLEVQGWTSGEQTASFTVAAGSNVAIVNIEIAPPAAAGVSYAQLERGIRGLERGMAPRF